MKKILKNIFVKNWELKLFSFLLALVIWFFIIPEEKLSFERRITIPLETHNIPAGLAMVEKPPPTIDVTIRAPNRLINDIKPDNVRARLELGNARVEQTEFPINRNIIILPTGAEVKEISPSQVRIRFERTKAVMMKVDPDLVGELPEDYNIVGVEITPSHVSVVGPESKISETLTAKTSPIDLSNMTETIEMETDLILPDSDFRVASFETRVRVKVIIESKNPGETVSAPAKKRNRGGL